MAVGPLAFDLGLPYFAAVLHWADLVAEVVKYCMAFRPALDRNYLDRYPVDSGDLLGSLEIVLVVPGAYLAWFDFVIVLQHSDSVAVVEDYRAFPPGQVHN